MLVTLVAILCNGQLCLDKVVTNSEQSGITMSACQVGAQVGIAEWPANCPVSRLEVTRLQVCPGPINSQEPGVMCVPSLAPQVAPGREVMEPDTAV
jgi:hypothetical protein